MMATITSLSLLVSALRHRERASSRSGRADSGMSEGVGELVEHCVYSHVISKLHIHMYSVHIYMYLHVCF